MTVHLTLKEAVFIRAALTLSAENIERDIQSGRVPQDAMQKAKRVASEKRRIADLLDKAPENPSEPAQRFNALAHQAWSVNVDNKWWDERRDIIETRLPGAQANVILGCLGLVTSEVAEAMEAVRKHHPETWGDAKTKDTLVRELAGAVIRCMDLATELALPLGEAIVAEIEANKARGPKHGGKAA